MYKFEIFRDLQGQFRWRLLGRFGRVIATSDASYRSEQIATGALQELRAQVVDADVRLEQRAA